MSYIVTKPLKSTGVAVFLAILFGGVGLFYTSILGGIVMTIIFPLIVFLFFFSGHFIAAIILACSYYIICIVWAAGAVRRYNRKIQRGSSKGNKIGKESDYSVSENYYQEYRNSLESDQFLIWMLLAVILAGILVYLAYIYK